jgi:hypothetical protein
MPPSTTSTSPPSSIVHSLGPGPVLARLVAAAVDVATVVGEVGATEGGAVVGTLAGEGDVELGVGAVVVAAVVVVELETACTWTT